MALPHSPFGCTLVSTAQQPTEAHAVMATLNTPSRTTALRAPSKQATTSTAATQTKLFSSRKRKSFQKKGTKSRLRTPFETSPVAKPKWFDPEQGDLSLHTLIVEGVHAAQLLSFIKANKSFTADELSNALKVSKRTLSRLSDGQGVKLDTAQGEGLVGLLQSINLGNKVFGSESAALEWFRKPAIALDGARPIDLLSTSFGTKLVMGLLNRIEFGVYS
jgi:putative toxin-antitoxin system antitoxin component (TIGR02293 family)